MGNAKKSGRTLFTDFAFSEAGPDSTRETTFFEGIEATRIEAGLDDGALRAVEVIEWNGPGGGWPYIKLTFDTQESLVRWSWTMWDGDESMLDTDLDFSPSSYELVEAAWGDARKLRAVLRSLKLSKYEARMLQVILDIMEERATAA